MIQLLPFSFLAGFQSVDFEELPVGTIRGWEPKHCEWTKASNCVSPELLKPCEPSSAWTYEQKDEGEPTLRKSLDRFYETCCQKTPVGGSPAYEAASCYVAAKIAALSDKEGTRYALLSLQIAQMVLSRNANKLFPKPTSSTSFAIPTETSCSLEEGKQIPGLSEDVLQLIVKKNMTNLR